MVKSIFINEPFNKHEYDFFKHNHGVLSKYIDIPSFEDTFEKTKNDDITHLITSFLNVEIPDVDIVSVKHLDSDSALDLNLLPKDTYIIHLERIHKLKQLVSFNKAIKSKKWNSNQYDSNTELIKKSRIHLDKKFYDFYLNIDKFHHKKISSMKDMGFNYIHVYYECFIKNESSNLYNIFNFLGISNPNANFKNEKYKKQEHYPMSEVIENYEEYKDIDNYYDNLVKTKLNQSQKQRSYDVISCKPSKVTIRKRKS
jgi:hypothetical protein